MNIDLLGRIKNINLTTSTPLVPLFEAVINSIQSVEDTGEKPRDNYIRIKVLRDTSQIAMKMDDSSVVYPIIGFIITDTGVGFNEENFISFQTSDSTYKSNIGGKGVGRLTWLKAFDSVKTESFYEDVIGLKGRSFTFSEDNGVSNLPELKVTKESKRLTKVHLEDYKRTFANKTPKHLDIIADKIIEHCLSFFILEKCPRMELYDDFDSINLNDHYKSHVDENMASDKFEIAGTAFNIKHIKLLFTKEHRVYLCANNRVVSSEKITNHISNLPKRITPENGEPFVYTAYVSSLFFDMNVNAERTAFIGYKDDEPSILPDDITWKAIFDNIYEKAAKYLFDYLEPIREKKIEKINDFVMNEAPQYRRILRTHPDKIEKINPDAADNKSSLDLELYKLQQSDELQNKTEVKALLEMQEKDISDLETYQKKYDEIMQKVNDESKMDLAKYIVKRRTMLKLLEKSLQIQDNGKYMFEKSVHELIIPLRTTSDDIDFEKHNLWIVDEKLAYHYYLASDVSLSKNSAINCDDNSRPDIIAFNRPHAFVIDKPYNSIVIVEFKRPCRNDYDKNDEDNNPIDQVYNYISLIKKSIAKDKNGRIINIPPTTPFYCYIICDKSIRLDDIAVKNNYKPTPDRLGYFYFHDTYNAYIEIIPYDKLLDDAMKRNRVLFDKLKIL